MKKLYLSVATAVVVLGSHQASAQILTSTITGVTDGPQVNSVNVSGAADYAIYNTEDTNQDTQFATEGAHNSFSSGVLTNTVNPVGDSGGGNYMNLTGPQTNGPFLFTGLSGGTTSNTDFQAREPAGGGAEFNYEAGALTITQTLFSASETLTLYSRGFDVGQTFTATLFNTAGTQLATTSVTTTTGTTVQELSSESTFGVTGATAGDKLTFVETFTVPSTTANGRYYPQAYLDGFSVAVPEPSTYAMIGLGLLGLAATMRFRRLNA